MHSKHDLLNGPIITNMLYLMVPTLISGFFQQLYVMTDAIILGKFVGESALAISNGSALQIINLFTNISAGIVSGSIITVALYHGAQDYSKILGSIKSSIVIICIMSLVYTTCCNIFDNVILDYLQVPSDIFIETGKYLKLYSLGFVFYCIFMISVGILRSFGESKTASKLLIYSYLFNIVFDLIFVGLIPLKESGIAIAYIITQIIGAVLGLHEIKKLTNINYIKEKFDFSLAKRILMIAIPTCINNVCFSISCILVQAKINSLGTDVITSFAIYSKIEKILWILLEGVNVSFITLVGQNYGANKYDRVKKSVRYAFSFSTLFCFLCTVVFLGFNRQLVQLFSSDEVVINITMDMMILLARFFVVYPAIDLISSFLNCVNHSTLSSVIMIVSIVGFRLLYLFTVLSSNYTYQQTVLIFPYSWIVCSLAYLVCYMILRRKIYQNKRA